MNQASGLFITFEGGEGSGKSTQAKMLAEFLEGQGHSVLQTREPGGTEAGNQIRELLINREAAEWNAVEEICLILSARSMHVRTVIKPALEKGQIVICDRFHDSTFAYQGYAGGFDIHKLQDLHDMVIGPFDPHITFLLDISPEDGLMRSQSRLLQESSKEDRFERKDISFHRKLCGGFLERASIYKDRMTVLSASQSIDDLHEKIKVHVQDRLAEES